MSREQAKQAVVDGDHVTREYLSIKEVAAILGLSESTVRNMVRDRRIPSIRTGNAQRTVRIAKADLEAHIAANRVGAGSVPGVAGKGISNG